VIKPDIESFRKPVIAAMPRLFEAKWGRPVGKGPRGLIFLRLFDAALRALACGLLCPCCAA